MDMKKRKDFSFLFNLMVAGVGFEPHDLQVMSLASYRTALPRDKNWTSIGFFNRLVKYYFVDC